MARDVEVRCRCGVVRGRLADAGPGAVNRVVCYCDDCQAFAHRLGRADLLDAHGGSDIVQVAPGSLAFQHGTERVAGLRLGPKGLYRFYATCCGTPLGNTVGPAIPFAGADADPDPDVVFGPPIGGIYGKYAVGTAPARARGWNIALYARAIVMVLGWRLRGRAWPHPFFDRATGEPRYPVTVLSPEERDALRPLCGPTPGAGRA